MDPTARRVKTEIRRLLTRGAVAACSSGRTKSMIARNTAFRYYRTLEHCCSASLETYGFPWVKIRPWLTSLSPCLGAPVSCRSHHTDNITA